jgi:hypothetical protein
LARSRMRWLATVLALTVVVSSVAVTLADRQAQQASPTTFGVYAWNATFSLPATEVSAARQVGGGTAQVLIDWGQIEFTEGYNDLEGFDFTAITPVDQRLRQVADSGLQPILLIANPPAWALQTPNTQGPLRSDKYGDYARFVRKLVLRYSPAPYNVRHVVLWPEPDARGSQPGGCPVNQLHRGWGDVPGEFAAMLAQTYPVVKAAAPSVNIVMGAVAYDAWGGANRPAFNSSDCGLFNYTFVDEVLAAGGAAGFDVFAFNAYAVFAAGWEAQVPGQYDVAAKTSYIRSRFPSIANKPFMVLEAGVWSDSSVAIPVTMPDRSIGTVVPNEEYQAAYPGKLFSRALASNLASVLWFGMRDFPGDVQRGLLDQSLNPKPVVETFRQATTRLNGATYHSAVSARAVSGGEPEGYVFTLPTGGRVAVLWAVGDLNSQVTLTTDLPGSNVRGYDARGAPLQGLRIEGDAVTLTVGHSPVYLLSGREHLRSFVPIGPRNAPNP